MRRHSLTPSYIIRVKATKQMTILNCSSALIPSIIGYGQNPFMLKHSLTQSQYIVNAAAIMTKEFDAFIVHGGEKNSTSMTRRIVGKKWKPISLYSVIGPDALWSWTRERSQADIGQ